MLKISRKSGSQDSSLLGSYTVATGKQSPTFRDVIVPSSSNSTKRVGLPSRARRTYLALETNTSFEMSEHVSYSLHFGTSQKTRILCVMCYYAISIQLLVITLFPLRGSGVPRNFFRGEGGQQIQLRTKRTGIWGR